MNTDNKTQKCINCGGTVKTEGHVYWPLVPAIAILFGLVARKGFCDECASKMNGIGILSTMALVIVILIIALIKYG